jgi:hypothetical protein
MNVYKSFPAISAIPENKGAKYIRLSANGTDLENATELQNSYNEAKLMVKEYTSTVHTEIMIMYDRGSLGYYDWSNNPLNIEIDTTYQFLIGTEVYAAHFDGRGETWVFNSNSPSFDSYRDKIYLVNSMLFSEPVSIICPPANYSFSDNFTIDKDYVNILSLTGERDIIFNGVGSLNLTANNVLLKGFDIQEKAFKIASNLDKVVIDNCNCGPDSFTDTNLVLSGTFTNLTVATHSFNGLNSELSGNFKNMIVSKECFSGDDSIFSGTFTDFEAKGFLFYGYTEDSILSGDFKRIYSDAGQNFKGKCSGTFNDIIVGNYSFWNPTSGFFKNIIIEHGFLDMTNFSGHIHSCFINGVGNRFNTTNISPGRIFNSVDSNGPVEYYPS